MLSALKCSVPVWFSFLLLVFSCGAPEGDEASPAPSTGDSVAVADAQEEQTGGELQFVHAAHILLRSGASSDSISAGSQDRTALERITSIRRRILSGEADFQEMAREYSQCPSSLRGGVLPAFTPGAVAWPLDSAARALGPGEISGVLRTRAGYHIVMRLED